MPIPADHPVPEVDKAIKQIISKLDITCAISQQFIYAELDLIYSVGMFDGGKELKGYLRKINER